MKYQIMLEILFMLLAHKKVTATEIATRFEISRRTVYRYIDAISLANIPVLCDRGYGGGFYIAASYKLPAMYFSEREFNRLFEILSAIEKQIGNDEEIENIINKLKSTKRELATSTELTTDSLIIDGSGWNDCTHSPKIQLLAKAIKDCTLLKCSYHARDGEITVREIEPHALILKQGLWYVYAYCRMREDFRLFKIARIEYLNPAGNFERKNFESAKLKYSEWYKNSPKINIQLEVDKSVASDVEEWLGIESVCTTQSGKIIASAEVPDDRGVIFEIMKFGSKVKVLKPDSLKKELLKSAQELVGLYT